VLRALVPADAAALAHHANNPNLADKLFDGFPQPYTLADAERWCDDARRAASAGWVWGITVDGVVVGCINLRPDPGWLRCNAEFGYWLGEDFWRRGIVGEALALVTAWAWAECPELTRLYAGIFAGNAASLGVATKAGYTLEARLPQSAIKDGRVIDRVQVAAYRVAGSRTAG
jgi:[ribosomal protein S5]-alanine N-acetyltransferase